MTKKDNCGTCLFWENRPELAMDINTGFCSMKDVFKVRGFLCDRFCRRGKGEMSTLVENGMYLPADPEDLDPYDADA